MDSYTVLKSLHLLGAVIFLGNIIVTAWWKATADRTLNPLVIAYAQRQVTLTDFVFTAVGVSLLGGSGYAMALTGPWSFGAIWITLGQALFLATGVVWIGVLIPVQVAQARMARSFTAYTQISQRYRRLSMLWMGFGSLAVLMPLIAFFLMIFKPD